MAWGIPIFLETSTSPGIVFIWGKLRFSGWWLSHPSENISQLGSLFPIYGKKNVPNHQPEDH